MSCAYQEQPPKRPLLAILAFIFALVGLIMLLSCNPQRQLDKAYQRVITDSSTLAKVRITVERIWPCVPAIGKPGKIIRDTTKVTDTAAINAYKKRLDSALAKFTPTSDIDSLKRALMQDLVDHFSPETTTVYERKTDTIPDTRAIELMQERLDAAKQAQNNAQGQITAKDKEIATWKGDASHWRLYAIGTWSLIAIILGVGFYLKFFTPTGATTSTIKKFFNK